MAETAIREGMAALRADAAFCYLMVGGDRLELLAAAGYPEERLDAWRLLPLDAQVPVSEAARTGDTGSAEMATGYYWGERALRVHVERILERARREGDDRLEQLAERFLR